MILFSPRRRGNFLKNCFSLSKDCADARYKINDSKLITYTENNSRNRRDILRAHVDNLGNRSPRRFKEADWCEKYVHCGHIHEWKKNIPIHPTNYYTIKIKNDIPMYDTILGSIISQHDTPEDIEYYSNNLFPPFVKSKTNIIINYSDIISKSTIYKKLLEIDEMLEWNINKDDLSTYIDWYFQTILDFNVGTQ